jgi:cytochrome c556
MRKALLLGAVALLATAGMARADGPSTIEIRQTSLDLLNGDFAGIRAVVAAKGDVKPLEASAKAIQRFAALMPGLFPKGSDTGDTKARPEIWSDAAGFAKAAAALGETSAKLAVLAKAGDAEGVEAQVKLVGAACGACHKDYRLK